MDVVMTGIAVGDALAKVWGENDPLIGKVVRAVNSHEALLEAAKEALEMLRENNVSPAKLEYAIKQAEGK